MFLHGGLFHILFNMLALWMFGAELERIWGTRYFLKFYFVTGIGAGVLTVLFSLLPFGVRAAAVQRRTSSARRARSTACCSPTRCTFPDRPIYMYFVFPIPAKIFVDDHGRDRVLLVAVATAAASPTPRISAGCSSGTLPEGRAAAHPLAEAEVPLPEVEDQPRPQEVRRLLRRPRDDWTRRQQTAGTAGVHCSHAHRFGRRWTATARLPTASRSSARR